MASVRTDPARVFIDSSVFFAASLSPRGAARELLLQGVRGRCQLLISELVLEETRRNLANKAPQALADFHQLRQIPALRKVPEPSKRRVLNVARVVDVKDAPIVAAALGGRADYLATHDAKHLLRQAEQLRARFGLAVLSPAEVLRLVRES